MPPATKTPVLPSGSLMQRAVIREALETSKLPARAREELRVRLSTQSLTEAQIVARVRRTEEIAASTGYVRVTDEADKFKAALEGLVVGRPGEVDGERVQPFRSLQEAYSVFFGQPRWTVDADQIMAAIRGFHMDERGRLTESIDSTTWSAAFSDSINKRAIAAYSIPARQAWRMIVSEISAPTDFRSQPRFRVGGYNTLQTVGEGSAYPVLTTPTDEQASFAPTKKGGVESITMEAIANGDIATIRRIADNCGIAAWLTLHLAIFKTILEGNAVIYDSVALFDAAHANTDAGAALAQATYETGRRKMRSQARPGETDGALSIVPRFLVVPNELEGVGFRLTTSAVVLTAGQNATEPNLALGTELIVVDELTDANDWFLVADPQLTPTIEVGFLNGREDPEIILADNPSEGSMYTADKIGVKVRHIWGLAVLDYRGFYRGQG